MSQILDVDGLSGRYTLRSYTYATYFDADGNLLEINTEGAAQVPEGYENAGRVVANSNSQEDSYFTDGGFEMVEGNPDVYKRQTQWCRKNYADDGIGYGINPISRHNPHLRF